MKQRRLSAERFALAIVGGILALFLVAPVIALIATTSWAELNSGLRHPLVWPALQLSVLTTSASLLITVTFGTPLAWTFARGSGRALRWLEAAVQLPIVIPPAVAGVALLLAFGRRGVFARWLGHDDVGVAFTTAAVILAEVFVSAAFFVQAAASTFRRLDVNLLLVARTFGASPLRIFFHLALPLSAPGLVAGAAMSWARSLGEFGATLMFAGNLQGVTQTLPLAIYTALESDLRAARALSIVLVVFAFTLLACARAALRRSSLEARSV